ncbi:ammonium transporter [Antrihabitans sp. YC2-6]|uniref:ammonium transporter n=1 Tax=Antrihabitans sp. YC2-6 TaxID=2799498 RepID=UPI0018F29F9D|nr:ammonium transporter [Antrihabitans sp. YC2-6]MBJ8348680.1 ammonium transporter [Antrihabitans sp. YC2-6]
MMLRKTVAIAAMVIGAMGVASGTTYAEPAPEPEAISFESKLVDRTVVTNLVGGTFEVNSDTQSFAVKNSTGDVVFTMPLAFSIDQVAHPFVPAVTNAGKTLSLKPDMDPAKATPFVRNVASPLENQRAINDYLQQFALASAIGGLAGTAVGLAIGCILGVPLIATVAGFLGVCAAGAAVGGVVGTIIAGGPTLAVAGVDLINSLNAAPGTTKWNYPDRIVVVPAA